MSITDLDEALASPGEATREFYRQQGREQEQDRILALLPAFFKELPNGNLVVNLTAVIKGEK
jgi:hypothetical protein